jgi:hypothetical protein
MYQVDSVLPHPTPRNFKKKKKLVAKMVEPQLYNYIIDIHVRFWVQNIRYTIIPNKQIL